MDKHKERMFGQKIEHFMTGCSAHYGDDDLSHPQCRFGTFYGHHRFNTRDELTLRARVNYKGS